MLKRLETRLRAEQAHTWRGLVHRGHQPTLSKHHDTIYTPLPIQDNGNHKILLIKLSSPSQLKHVFIRLSERTGYFQHYTVCLWKLQKRNFSLQRMESTERFTRKIFHLQSIFWQTFLRLVAGWPRCLNKDNGVLLLLSYMYSWKQLTHSLG